MNTARTEEFNSAVCRLILESPMVKIDQVEPSMNLSDIHMDSLEKLSMAMDLEELFDIEISDNEVEEFTLVSDVVKYLEVHVANTASSASPNVDPEQACDEINKPMATAAETVASQSSGAGTVA